MELIGNMENLLFIYNNPLDGSYGGSQGTKKALDGLSYNYNVKEYSCIKKPNKFTTLGRNILGFSGNLSPKDCKNILSILSKNQINIVFFDVSLHGRLVKILKRRYPNVKIVVNYHNCEARYFGNMLKTKGLLYYPIFKAAIKNELLSKKFADFHILITNEDREELKIYKNYCIIPVTLKDEFKEEKVASENKYILFVGAAQYANIEGARFIIEKLAINTNKKFLIVGKGMKTIFPDKYENVEIMDYVPCLSEVYNNASAFICPLFSGSGAKVKVAEALMYGKKVIGTPLSFYGYELLPSSFAVCNSEKEFINELNGLDMEKRFYKENRMLFLEKYDALNNGKYYSMIKDHFQKGEQ